MTTSPAPGPWVEGLVAGRRGVVVHRKRDRAVWRVEEAGRVWFAKRGGPRKRGELRTEARNLLDLHAAGVPVTGLLAHGEHGGAPWLVTEAAAGRSLAHALHAAPERREPGCRRSLLRAVAQATRAFHETGFAFTDLTAEHLFVRAPPAGSSESTQVTFIDLARAEHRRNGPGRDVIARDLAALLVSLPYGAANRIERTRLVRDGSGLRGDPLRELLALVERHRRRLLLRTRWRHRHGGASPAVGEALRALRGADDRSLFDALMDPSGMEVVRTLADRENRRFRGPGGRAYFMKTYPAVSRGFSPAMREREGIELFARSGILVCREEAYGEDVERGSFLVVRGCAGEPLDDVIRAGVSVSERRALVRATAQVWRRMRGRGLRHRDAYPCHVFTARRPQTPGGFELRLIDLTRAGRAPFPRERWFVKDAAQLWHGAPRPPVTRTDAVRWLRVYFGIGRLDGRAKRFARRVATKERRMTSRAERKRGTR